MAAHRYWRIINVDTPGSAAVLEPSEFQMLASGVDKTSLATKTATTTSFGPLTDLFDADLNTRVQWPRTGANNYLDASWFIKFDFAAGDQNINGIKHGQFDTGNQNFSQMTLQWSDNNTDWTTQASVSGLAQPGNFTLSSLIDMSEPIVLSGVSSTVTAGSVRPPMSGVAATGNVGTVKATRSKALTGNAATGVLGSLRSPLTGLAATSAVGSVAVGARSKAITGNAATGGVYKPGIGFGITTAAATGSPGSIAPGLHRPAVTTASGTGAVGTLTPHSTISCVLTGSVVTGTAGAPRPALAKLLTGTPATGAVGTVRKGAGLTGVASTAAVGTVARARGIVLSGVSAAFATGSVRGVQPKIPTITITSCPSTRVLVGS